MQYVKKCEYECIPSLTVINGGIPMLECTSEPWKFEFYDM